MSLIADKFSQIAPSLTLAITATAKKMQAQGQDIASFGAGEPDFDTPQHIKDAAIEALQAGRTKYTAATGIPELKRPSPRSSSSKTRSNTAPSKSR